MEGRASLCQVARSRLFPKATDMPDSTEAVRLLQTKRLLLYFGKLSATRRRCRNIDHFSGLAAAARLRCVASWWDTRILMSIGHAGSVVRVLCGKTRWGDMGRGNPVECI